MSNYKTLIVEAYTGYYNYLVNEVLYPSWHNYFYWLIALSLVVWLLELFFPWRKNQAPFRKDFWLDGFYMFFNFFLFSLIGYNALSMVASEAFNNTLALIGIKNIVAIEVGTLPHWAQLLIIFIVADFIQWNVHRMLHRNKYLWEFHKVHHSVKEMGFAAHLRFHWMETIIYKTILYVPLSMIGFSISDFFIVHIITVAIGHLNHANINLTYGPFKYILNNPVMHLWHHAQKLPAKSYGVNFGISLSVWDYLFKTAYIPYSKAEEPLGFNNDDNFPQDFIHQEVYPFIKNK